MSEKTLVHYLPILTTVLSIAFCAILLLRYRERRGTHLLWWAFGISAYGLGTGLESAVTLFGNTPVLNKAWYVAGALWGGYPLAQGSVYLHLSRRWAHLLSAVTVPILLVLSALVFLSPVNVELLEAHRPSGALIGWSWLRLCTPFVNLYAVIFLIGGAMWSAWKFAQQPGPANSSRAIGNSLIAVGAILPGIGGSMAKAGVVEALYVGELAGLVLIWWGYRWCVRLPFEAPRTSEASAEAVA